MMEIIFFAVIAALVLGRLYQVLGQKTGAEPPPLRDRFPDRGTTVLKTGYDRPSVEEPAVEDNRPLPASGDTSPLGQALADIRARDRGFDPDKFLEGACSAYEMIVTAYGRGDEQTLRSLVSDEVFGAYQDAIAARKSANAPPIEVVRVSDVALKAAELEGSIARLDVHFSADLQDGGDGLRPTDEVWTFERDTQSRKPDWILTAVDAA